MVWCVPLLAFLVVSVSAAQLTAPELEAPANGAQTFIPTPHLSWLPVCAPRAVDADCGGYLIEIASTPDFAAPIVRRHVAAVLTRMVPSEALSPGQWYWRVAALPASDEVSTHTEWSEVRQLRVVVPGHIISVSADASFSDMQDAFNQAQANSPAVVKFSDGIQAVLDPGSATEFLSLTNCSDVVVDFAGAHLTFTRPIGFVHLEDCKRVVVRNLTVDLDPLPYTAFRVDKIDSDSPAFIGTVEHGHPIPESLNMPTNFLKGSVLDGATTRTKRGVLEVVGFSKNWTALGSNRYRVPLDIDPVTTGLAVGDVFLMGERTGPSGFKVEGCDEVAFISVTAHACANECFTSKYTSKWSILGGGLHLLPGRFKSANDGGHNHHSARIGAWIEGGIWENTGDDICHVSGLGFSATESAGRTVRLQRSSGDTYAKSHGGSVGVQVGDVLQFYDHSTGQIIGEPRVLSVDESSPTSKGTTVVTLDAVPAGIKLGQFSAGSPNSATQIYNLNASATQFVFARNQVRNGRRFGVLAKGLRLVVEDNTFVGMGGGAVQLFNSPVEGLCARSAVIRRNVAVDTVQLLTHGDQSPFWTAVLPPGGAGPSCHRDVLFEDNTVDSGPHAPFLLGGVEGLSVIGNSITRCASDGFGVVELTDSSDIEVQHKVLSNLTDARLCTKQPRLVKVKGSSAIYFLDYMFGPHVSQELHHVGSCNACGVNLCDQMGVSEVSANFVSTRNIGSRFSCTMLPGPRFLKCSTCEDSPNAVYFQPTPDSKLARRIGSCLMCPGNVCSAVVDVAEEYLHALSVTGGFTCEMAQGDASLPGLDPALPGTVQHFESFV